MTKLAYMVCRNIELFGNNRKGILCVGDNMKIFGKYFVVLGFKKEIKKFYRPFAVL